MSNLPMLSALDIVKAFDKAGFEYERKAGRHFILYRAISGRILSVPNHNPVKRGTLRTLIRLAGLTVEEFIDMSV
jgi:predicted RNA binding protein YcfA (HicA-like mRNA interferase family)